MAEVRAAVSGGSERPILLEAVDLHDETFRQACARAARLVTAALGVPAAFVSFTRDLGSEVLAAAVGLPEPLMPLTRVPHELARGLDIITRGRPVAIADAARDAPALRAHGIGAYLGVPIGAPGAHAVGALVALDVAPREWPDDAVARLADVAALLGAELQRRATERDARERTSAVVRTSEALLAQIEHREQVEATLRQSEARWRTLIEHAPEAIVVYDVTGDRFVAVNENAEQLFGVPRDRLLQMAPLDVSAPVQPDGRTAQDVLSELAQRALGGEAPVYDWLVRGAAGREVPCELRLVRLPGGRPAIRGSITDISARKRAEHERAELLVREQAARRDAEAARERLTLLVEASSRLAASLRIDATLETAAAIGVPLHAAWSAVWHVEPDGRVHRVTAGHEPDDESLRTAVESRVAHVLRSGAARLRRDPAGALLIVPLRARDRTLGALAWISAPGHEAYDRDDLALAEELARRAALALDAARLYEEAQSANRLKDEFLATLSHELRTPLAAVLGWASLIRSDDLPAEEVDEALDAIERNARAQARLVEDVLEVSRIVTGKIRVSRRPVELPPTIRAAVDTLRPTAQEKELTIAVDLPEQPVLVLGDPDRLEQVWGNLLSNAIKFTPRGGEVSVRMTVERDTVEVHVRDTGEGIPEEVLPFVFERFRQGDSSSTRRHGGLGLGLALVRHFVELHGGTVAAHSGGRGTGADLLVRLPVLSRRSALPLLAAVEPATERARRPLAGLRVLVVDDDADVRAMMRAVLTRRGATVVEAESVAEAVEAVEQEVPDVVLSDLQMPGEDGYALLARLKAREQAGAAPIPTAAVTAHAGEEHRAQALAAGFQEQVAKPLDAETLSRLVAALAQREPPASL